MLRKTEGRRRTGGEDEIVGWHHWLDGHEFEQALEVGDGQGGMVCCSPWGCKELDTTEPLNWTEQIYSLKIFFPILQLPFCFIDCFLCRAADVLKFDVFSFIFYFVVLLLVWCPKHHCQHQCQGELPLCFLLRVLQSGLTFKCLIHLKIIL